MNKVTKYIAAGILSTSVVSYSSFVFAADGTGNASASIQQAIAIVENTSMDFATIAVDGSGGTVTLTSASAISGATYTYSGTAAAGNFTASGDASTAVTISFTDGSLTGPGTAMALNNFTHDAGGSPTTDGTGDLVFSVGGDLVVNATQTSGSYSGTYTVTVNY